MEVPCCFAVYEMGRMKKGKQYVTDLVNLLKREPGDSSTKLRVSFRKKPKRTPPNLDKERMGASEGVFM